MRFERVALAFGCLAHVIGGVSIGRIGRMQLSIALRRLARPTAVQRAVPRIHAVTGLGFQIPARVIECFETGVGVVAKSLVFAPFGVQISDAGATGYSFGRNSIEFFVSPDSDFFCTFGHKNLFFLAEKIPMWRIPFPS